MRKRLLIGTRGSKLALVQTEQVLELMRKLEPDMKYEIVPIRTKGDKLHDLGNTAVEGKSMFTKEIMEALLSAEVDVAIHSMKDLTADLPEGLAIAAVPKRVDARDVLVARNGTLFKELQRGARIGTSSSRRRAQLLAVRKDLEMVEMRGNVDTRLRKLEQGEYDGIILAAAGLLRLGLDGKVTEYLSMDLMLPAVGQGAIAIQVRENDQETKNLVSRLDHEQTRRAIQAERAFARKLGADCHNPIAAHAEVESGRLTMDGLVATPDGQQIVRSQITSESPNPEKVGEELAELLLSEGAATILEVA